MRGAGLFEGLNFPSIKLVLARLVQKFLGYFLEIITVCFDCNIHVISNIEKIMYRFFLTNTKIHLCHSLILVVFVNNFVCLIQIGFEMLILICLFTSCYNMTFYSVCHRLLYYRFCLSQYDPEATVFRVSQFHVSQFRGGN